MTGPIALVYFAKFFETSHDFAHLINGEVNGRNFLSKCLDSSNRKP